MFFMVQRGVPTLGQDGFVSGFGFDGSGFPILCRQGKSMPASQMLDFYRPPFHFPAVSITGIGVLEETFRPIILNLSRWSRFRPVSTRAWTLLGH